MKSVSFTAFRGLASYYLYRLGLIISKVVSGKKLALPPEYPVLSVNISLRLKELSHQHCAACRAAKSIVRETDELVIVNGVFS